MYVYIIFIIILLASGLGVSLSIQKNTTQPHMPIIAIANYGQHDSLHAAIEGIKKELRDHGYIENQNIHYEIMDVSFDRTLIPQMIARLKQFKPAVIVPITTPVAQFSKNSVRDIPIVYSVITDPVSAGLLSFKNKSENNITGSSDKQDLNLFLSFAKLLLPNAKSMGLLYSPSEANDIALVNMMSEAGKKLNIQVIAIPIDHIRDMNIRIQALKNKVDFIYVGGSGPILPSLPTIAKFADKYNLPVFCVEPSTVKNGLALASYGVNYQQVGKNTGKLIAEILKDKPVSSLHPIYPSLETHQGYINLNTAKKLGITIPKNYSNLTTVE